jgi:hypothetical protein
MIYQILLPAKHHCNDGCKYQHFFGYITNTINPQYDDTTKKCQLDGFTFRHQSPRIIDFIDAKMDMWLESGKGCYCYMKLDEIVITDTKISIIFDYPTGGNGEFRFNFESNTGFTRKHLIKLIVDTYQKMYENTQMYSIFGHEIGDLWIEGITYDSDDKIVTLSIGS